MFDLSGTIAPRAAPLARTADRARAGLLLGGIVACYVGVIAVRPLVAPDEFRYAEVPREMLASGDWIVPRLDGVLYFEKPPLGYWITALSIGAFGENAAALRLPSALSTLVTAAVVFALARRFGSGSATAAFAALGYLTSLAVAAVGTTAVLDSLFTLGVTASLAALFLASEQRPGAARQRWLAVSGAACGAAFLTKGFLAFAIPITVAVPYLVWSRRSRDLLRLPWTPLISALAIAAPWSIAIARAQPDFWHQFVVYEHLRRFADADAPHAAPFWYFVPVVAIGALPWITLLPHALRSSWVSTTASPLQRFCVCWFVAPLVIVSASSGKLMTYALPCFPPLFILLSHAALSLPRVRLAHHLRRIAGIAAALGAVAAVTLLVLPAWLADFYAGSAPSIRVLGAGVALVAAAVAASALTRRDAIRRAHAIGAAAALGFVAAALAFPTDRSPKIPERWLAQRVGPIPADAIVVADRNLVHAVCWQLRRADVLVLGSAGELRYGLAQPDQRARRIDSQDLAALLSDPTRTHTVVIIGQTRRTSLPPGVTASRAESAGNALFAIYDPPIRLPAGPAPRVSASSST